MATTTNFGWETPDDTDLVKDGALAMRTLGNAIDASLVDLKGGTTGQVLSKNSNTDMDFTWVTSDDANAIQNAIVDAKGDLITATAADTPARLAVGNNGDTLVADSSASTGLRWQPDFSVGRNKIINGDFAINQRNFTSITADGYGFDRWRWITNGTTSYSTQTFTLGTAPVTGYEGKNFARLVTTTQSAANTYTVLIQPIESVRTLANQTVTISFWAKAASGTPKVFVETSQRFGTGGSPSSQINTSFGQVTLSTSWARYTVTAQIPSISGKTIGTNNDDKLELNLWVSAGTDFDARTGSLGIQLNTFDFWGVQVEAGNVATAFQTATGTLAGELAACQRYYYRNTPAASGVSLGQGSANGSRYVLGVINLPVSMRVAPTSADFSAIFATDGVNAGVTISALAAYGNSQTTATYYFDCTSGLTQYRNYKIDTSSSSGYLGFSAEL